MEFVKKNFIQTSTAIVVNSNTSTALNIMNRDTRFQYASSGFGGATTVTMTINFDETLTVNRLSLIDHNLKSYTAFYNGSTANTFALTSTGATTSSDFSTNSSTSHYMQTASVDCTSVSFDFKDTLLSGADKAVGYILISAVELDFDRIPSAKDYRPKIEPKDVVHRLSDGGTRIQNLKDVFKTDIGLNFVSQSFRDNLKSVFDTHREFVFTAFPTLTSDNTWDQVSYPCVWEGSFDFFSVSDNASGAGFSGSIRLRETPV